jgi:hypothetical protein
VINEEHVEVEHPVTLFMTFDAAAMDNGSQPSSYMHSSSPPVYRYNENARGNKVIDGSFAYCCRSRHFLVVLAADDCEEKRCHSIYTEATSNTRNKSPHMFLIPFTTKTTDERATSAFIVLVVDSVSFR